ncbi:hypothetical protein MNBD_BACTEROID01-2040 [hydrothermal vent metagenome]|uniref:Dinitrogenase iron-molybdenum cofactor biosynthesis domain-containing protein n=1 Tax=hydrothermal vent metagenome TaxID=652676 RepID=A0A3B0TP73_9ZZZZ
MKRVAIPVVHGKLSEYFGQCSHYEIFEIVGGAVTSSKTEVLSHYDVAGLPDWAAQQGITDIIAYKVDKSIITRFVNNKINLFIGAPVNPPAILIEDYLNGRLKSDERIIREITSI